MKDREPVMSTERLPTEELESELLNAGWVSLNNERSQADLLGNRIDMRGVNDRTSGSIATTEVAGFDPGCLSLAVTHAPVPAGA